MATPNPFARYIKATAEAKHRGIIASYGEVGTGKTQWWCGAPGPILFQTLDQGLEGVVEPFVAEGKEIYIANYDMGLAPGEEFTHEAAVVARDKFVVDYEHALSCGAIRTVVWDRETDMWNLFFFAEFGTDDAFAAAPPKDWDRLKGKIRRLIAMAKASDINLGIIQGMKNEWVQKVNKKTGAAQAGQSGNRIRAGMDEIEALVHINVEHVRTAVEGAESVFSINVGKSRGPGSRDVQDKSFDNVSFADFMQMVFPDSSPEDWA